MLIHDIIQKVVSSLVTKTEETPTGKQILKLRPGHLFPRSSCCLFTSPFACLSFQPASRTTSSRRGELSACSAQLWCHCHGFIFMEFHGLPFISFYIHLLLMFFHVFLGASYVTHPFSSSQERSSGARQLQERFAVAGHFLSHWNGNVMKSWWPNQFRVIKWRLPRFHP